MPLRRGSGQRGLVLRSQRRKTGWGLGPGSTDATPISASGSSLVGLGAGSLQDGNTLVRLRGELLITIITATTALDGLRGAFGIGIVSQPAFVAGIGSVPTPITEEADENWIYHTYFTVLTIAGGEQWGNAGSTVFRQTVDSKAMRKFDADKILYAAVEVVETGAIVADVSFNSRVLVKLS